MPKAASADGRKQEVRTLATLNNIYCSGRKMDLNTRNLGAIREENRAFELLGLEISLRGPSEGDS